MTACSRPAPDQPAPRVVNLGCRLNTYESEVIRDLAASAGLRDAVIVNTCAVTAEAERQARQVIRRSRRENPDARIIATSCAAQIAPDQFAAMPEVDQVLGNADKMRAASYAPKPTARVRVSGLEQIRLNAPHLLQGFGSRARAFMQVQNGCNHSCTFCVIPLGRGPSFSTPIGAIVTQAQQLVANGFLEIVLTGVDLTSYGTDLPGRPTLGQMVRRLLRAVPKLCRLRLSSVDPAEIDDDLLTLLETEPRLMPHLHLSVQAGDNLILKRMKRRHNRDDVIELVEKVRARRPDTAFGADFIAGFPTETAAMAQRSVDLVRECGLTYLHVFPYSPRTGTPAARIPLVPAAERRRRAAALRAAGDHELATYLRRQVGQTRNVLTETPDMGRTEHFAPVALSASAEPGVLLQATINGASGTTLQGRPA